MTTGGDPLSKVLPGDPLRVKAATWNRLLDTARAEERRAMRQQGGVDTLPDRTGIVLVKNDSGEDLDRYAIVQLGGQIVTPADNVAQFQERPLYLATKPTEPLCPWAILQEPLRAGAVGRAMESGISPVLLDVDQPEDLWADVVIDEPGHLRTGTEGTAEILYCEPVPDPPVPVWGLVRFPCPQDHLIIVRNDGLAAIPAGAPCYVFGTVPTSALVGRRHQIVHRARLMLGDTNIAKHADTRSAPYVAKDPIEVGAFGRVVTSGIVPVRAKYDYNTNLSPGPVRAYVAHPGDDFFTLGPGGTCKVIRRQDLLPNVIGTAHVDLTPDEHAGSYRLSEGSHSIFHCGDHSGLEFDLQIEGYLKYTDYYGIQRSILLRAQLTVTPYYVWECFGHGQVEIVENDPYYGTYYGRIVEDIAITQSTTFCQIQFGTTEPIARLLIDHGSIQLDWITMETGEERWLTGTVRCLPVVGPPGS